MSKTSGGRKAIVIGAGVAGLATALRLRSMDFDVDVFESASTHGGKMGVWESKGYRFDTGPSLFTLPGLVDDALHSANLKPEDYFTYHRHTSACHYFWEDGTTLIAGGNAREFSAKAADKLGGNADQIMNYLQEAGQMYNITKGVFLERSLHRWQTYTTSDVLRALPKLPFLGLYQSLHQRNVKRFPHTPKLVQLFDRFATYNGSSPYLTPGIMQMICHLEHNIGTYFPKGGMYAIPNALYRAGVDIGVKYHFGTPVKAILCHNNKAIGVQTADIEKYADVVVSNADVHSTYKHLMPDVITPRNVQRQKPSSSALIYYWGMTKQFSQLDLHNVFFSEDYYAEFDHIFQQSTVFEDPTVYINITSKLETEDAPPDGENWFVMVNVPADSGQDWQALAETVRENVIAKLSRILEDDIRSLIVVEKTLTPPMIERQTSSQGGALYGSSSNDRMAAFFRHPNFSKHIKGLYFCGGSVHPGGGIPLCLHSAKITAQIINQS